METRSGEQGQVTAVIYARIAPDSCDTEEVSLNQQVEDARRYCEERDYCVVEEYRAVGRGTSKHEPEFKRLIRDGQKGKFDRVICWKLDRLARGSSPWASMYELAESHGVKIETVREPMSELVLRLFLMASKMEMDSMMERMRMGRDAKAK